MMAYGKALVLAELALQRNLGRERSVVHADIDKRHLSVQEQVANIAQLLVAGPVATRSNRFHVNSIGQGRREHKRNRNQGNLYGTE